MIMASTAPAHLTLEMGPIVRMEILLLHIEQGAERMQTYVYI